MSANCPTSARRSWIPSHRSSVHLARSFLSALTSSACSTHITSSHCVRVSQTDTHRRWRLPHLSHASLARVPALSAPCHVSPFPLSLSPLPSCLAAFPPPSTLASCAGAPCSSSQHTPPHERASQQPQTARRTALQTSSLSPAAWLRCRSVHECWGHGATLDECVEAVRQYPLSRMAPYLAAGSTFCIRIHAYGHTFDMDEQKAMIQRFAFLPVQSRLSFSHAQHRYWLLFDYMEGERRKPSSQAQPSRVFFCREVSRYGTARIHTALHPQSQPSGVLTCSPVMAPCRWRRRVAL